MPRMPTTATLRSSPSWAPSQWHQLRRNGHASFGRSYGQRTRWLRSNGGGEAIGLANLCEKAMRFPAIDPKIPDGQLAKQLKAWIVTRKAEAIRDRTVAGGKYPHLCRFANHLYEALGSSLRIIAWIAQSRPRFDPFKIEVADIQVNGSQPAMTPATSYSVRFWNIARCSFKNIPKSPSIGSTSPS